MTSTRPDRIVEVFTPTGARHLARLAADIERQLLKQIETLPPEALHHLLRVGADLARARDAYERFRRRCGVQRMTIGGSDS